MATDEQAGSPAGEEDGTPAPEEGAGASIAQDADPAAGAGPGDADAQPHFVEVWNDYDPSQRFAAIFPVGEREGATASSVAYYIIEPGKHTGDAQCVARALEDLGLS